MRGRLIKLRMVVDGHMIMGIPLRKKPCQCVTAAWTLECIQNQRTIFENLDTRKSLARKVEIQLVSNFSKKTQVPSLYLSLASFLFFTLFWIHSRFSLSHQ